MGKDQKIAHLYDLVRFSHKYLYDKFLANAGEFRNINDKNSGKVYFGGEKQREFQFEFSGVHPSQIIDKVAESIVCLVDDKGSPIECAMRFYQKFVLCHPFYDANGRIARFIVNIYMNYNHKFVDWEHLLDNKLFLKQLNNCHKRNDKPKEFKEYFKYLVNAFSKHVRDKKDFETYENPDQ